MTTEYATGGIVTSNVPLKISTGCVAAGRLVELRAAAARRRDFGPNAPDTAEELAERDEEREGWLRLQGLAV